MKTSRYNQSIVDSGDKYFGKIRSPRESVGPFFRLAMGCKGTESIQSHCCQVLKDGENLIGSGGGRCAAGGIAGEVVDRVKGVQNDEPRSNPHDPRFDRIDLVQENHDDQDSHGSIELQNTQAELNSTCPLDETLSAGTH